MPTDLAKKRREFLSTELASRGEKQFAIAAAIASALVFCAVLPFATTQLIHVPAFIPTYESALVICDLVTAVLLFGQFKFLRSRALFVLASGYLFTAFIAVAHALTFPGVYSTTGLLGAGPQSTAWLYMFWHGGFPLFVIAYALLKHEDDKVGALTAETRSAFGLLVPVIPLGIAGALAIACGFTLIATVGHDSLPVLLVNNRFTLALNLVVSSVWALTLVGLLVLLWRRPHTVLDLWLMVVLCAWLFDIGLSAVWNGGRFDVGWYAGRIYGLAAASSLLIVLLIEISTHYARLAFLSAELSVANNTFEQLSLKDDLTDLANRRYFDTHLDAQIAVARRHKRPLALVLCDVDAFKAYNDAYGHQAGDACLQKVAATLRACCRRPTDMAARYGGEEFALILPDTDSIGAALIAESAREAVAALRIPHAHSPTGPFVSVSGGVAVQYVDISTTAEALISAADQRLFLAKKRGRNRMVSADPLAA